MAETYFVYRSPFTSSVSCSSFRKNALCATSSPNRRSQRLHIACSSERVQFSANLSTDLPLRERYGIPFEDYLKQDERVLRAFFPDKDRSQKLKKDIWRIYMLPVGFFLLSVQPVVDMQISLADKPRSATSSRMLSLKAVGWELRGATIKPSDFLLLIDGALYSEERGKLGSRLKGTMSLSVDLSVPQNLNFVPRETIQSVGKSVLNQLLEGMKDKVNHRVIQDYARFAWEQSRAMKTQ